MLKILGLNNQTISSREIVRPLNKIIIKRRYHRGFLLENTIGNIDGWKAKLNNKIITGEQAFIETSIDWWCDKKIELSLKQFSKIMQVKKYKIVIHQGFKIINDNGKDNEWYILHHRKLIKGTRSAIIKKIDIYIEHSRTKKPNNNHFN
ncbi:DUF3319 domain-containing protein [Photobacterium frigidiphilum]|nr:DUF3319 domain-containing protein [Photobacterium frigidiphilum]